MRVVVLRWGLAVLYIALVLMLLLLFPVWLWAPLLAAWVGYAAWSYLTFESFYGATTKIRPLTPWDVPDYADFRQRLTAACEELGLKREPVWAVELDDYPNATAVGGPRGMVVLTQELLRLHPQEELLAVVGHELKHLAARDSLPALIGGSWLGLMGWIGAWLDDLAHNMPGVFAAAVKLVALVLNLSLWIIAWVAQVLLARRSRMEEHLADLAGARVGSPAAMIGALERIHRWEEEKHVIRSRSTRWSPAWITEQLHASHPPHADRVAFLTRAAERGEIGA
jgi:Zn-dependent protease with chaperone function